MKRVKNVLLGWGAPLLVLVAASGCAGSAQPPESSASGASAQRDYTGPVLDMKNLPGEFLWEQQLTARYGALSQSFGAVIQSADGELTVLGLTPFNTRAFAIEQRGYEFRFTNYVHRDLPFEPKSILIDIHRTFFVGVPRKAKADGRHEHVALGEKRVDEWRGGRLVKRTFERIDAPGKLIEISYGEGYAPGAPPPLTVFKNGWYGYSLEVETTNVTAL